MQYQGVKEGLSMWKRTGVCSSVRTGGRLACSNTQGVLPVKMHPRDSEGSFMIGRDALDDHAYIRCMHM